MMKNFKNFRRATSIAIFIFVIMITHIQANDVVSKRQFLELAQKFIKQNEKKMPFLKGAMLDNPAKYRDLKSGELNWRVSIINDGNNLGYFYASGKTLADGNILMWFTGSGVGDDRVTANNANQFIKGKEIHEHKGKSSSDVAGQGVQKPLKEHDGKDRLESIKNVPKGSHRPIKGPSSLIFNRANLKKVVSPEDPRKSKNAEAEEPSVPTAWQVIKSETFESDFPNDWNVYAASGADAYWDDTSYKKHSGSWGGFCADAGSDGTGFGGKYVNNMNAWMIYGPFSLADATNAKVEFWHWTNTEANYDKFHYVASIDGTHFYGYYLTGDMTDEPGNVNGWLSQTFDLTNVYQLGDITGQSQVWIAFVFQSDGSIIEDGTYLDDIYIKKYVGDELPALTEHFMCRDGNDPYNTQTQTFNTSDTIATEFTNWNSSSSTASHSVDIKFYDTSNNYYWSASGSIPAGRSSWIYWAGIYIAGHNPANEPGQWTAKVFLDDNQVAYDNFTIQQGEEPTITEHFMCKDGDNPYSTRADTFYTTDYIATDFMDWNTSNCTRDWTANCSFFDTEDDYYAGSDITLHMGRSSDIHWVGMYISGHQPANEPGHWIARVRLEGTLMYEEDFYIVEQTTSEPDISVNPTSLEFHQTSAPQPAGASSKTEEDTQMNQYHAKGLKIPEYVRAYWKTHQPNIKYDASKLLSSVDWSANDSPVKSQGNCGSCWAFAAVALVENIGVWNDLSEQEIISCSAGDCDGGWYWDALQYIHDNGVVPEACFPYTAQNGNCDDRCTNPDYLSKITDYTPAQGLWGEPATVNDLKAELQKGPLAVAMLVPEDGTFDNYSGGVYNYNGGPISWENGHAVLLVGYNDDGQYFKAKNSWGTNWGENGYFRIAYDDVSDDVHFGMYACAASGPYQEGGTTGDSFIIQNNGNANLVISSITGNKSWLTFSPTTIPVIAPGNNQTVTVAISNWSLVNCPNETGSITINSNDPDQPTVTVNVLAVPSCNTNPVLQVNPTSLSFSSTEGSNPPSKTFAISNGGNGSFSWTASDNTSWISCNPTSGITTNETDNVSVSVNSSGLSPGTYTGVITVAAPAASGSPKTVNVTFHYGGPCSPPYVKAKDASGSQDSDVVIDIEIDQNPTPIDAFGLNFTFDPSKLSFVSVAKGNLTSDFDFFNGQQTQSGNVRIGGFDTSPIPIGSSGNIARVTLHVNQCSEGESITLGIQNLIDDLSEMNPCNGTFTCQSCLLGDVNNDGSISPGDALCAFQIYLNNGNLPSNDCDNDCALYAADVNCTPNGITPGDALYIFMAYLNGESPPLDCDPTLALKANNGETFSREVNLIELNATGRDELRLSVEVTNAKGMRAFGLNIGYPEEALRLVKVERSQITQLWQHFGAEESITGAVTVGGFNEEPAPNNASGSLAVLTFRIIEPADSVELWLYNLTDDLLNAKLRAETFIIPLLPTSVEKVSSGGIPEEYALQQNYPNPFNMETDIHYQLPEVAHVTLAIYNAMGQKVKTLVSAKQNAGHYIAHWNGKDDFGNDLPSGIYIYKIAAGHFKDAKKLVLVK